MSTATVGARVPVLRSFSEGGPRGRTIFIAPKCTALRRILIAGMGTSPAVLTETVWALAHQEKSSLKESLAALTAAQKSLMKSSFNKATKNIGRGRA